MLLAYSKYDIWYSEKRIATIDLSDLQVKFVDTPGGFGAKFPS